MPIALSNATLLENASIQYTYPEMNIKNITKDSNGNSSFYFQSSIAASTFTFIDSSSNSYISGTPAQGIISKSIHTINNGNINAHAYELTVKHISLTNNLVFYVVFPLDFDSGSSWTIIEEINNKASSSPTSIDIYADEYKGKINKGLNDIIKSNFIYGSDIYKYTNNNDKYVFVFKTSLKVNISSSMKTHDIWSTTTGTGNINLITPDNNTQVLEEIECDYSGDTIKEPEINNKNLSKTFSRVGSITIFFAVFALYTAFFYKYIPEIYKEYTPTEYGLFFLYMIFFSGITGLAFSLPISYKNINFLNIDVFKPASFYALLFIPLWDFAYKLMMLLVYSSIYEIPSSIYNFIFSYFKSDEADNDLKKYNMFLLGLLLIIWVLFVCVILVK